MGRKAATFDAALPRYIDGTRVHEHPWLWHLKRYMLEFGLSRAKVADSIGVRPQTLAIWVNRAKADRRFKLPRERAIEFAELFRVPLWHFYCEE